MTNNRGANSAQADVRCVDVKTRHAVCIEAAGAKSVRERWKAGAC
jgi:hypothetical protein